MFLMRVCTPSHFSCVQFCVTPWIVTCQAPLSTGFSRQEYCSGLPCPPPGDLPDPGTEPMSLMSPASAGMFFTTSTTSGSLMFLIDTIRKMITPFALLENIREYTRLKVTGEPLDFA
ncbi:unnamed protein product [Rangifer tarandus platyrhynchus]|uniref:Uncharacterized protein n=2 Tax=Rangifer tarandus platyrhynchus TaxID=3082113 RepID=A0ABN8ZRC0_RANTA|nr:unnamed protein product [Rangifer tarandus platyrhynchus]